MEEKKLSNQKIEGGLRTREAFHKKSEHGKPLVSIITVVRNGEKYLEQTIQSVLNQTYKNIEYIIIDGASTDGTLNIIRKYEDRIAYWVSEPDGGIYEAMNKGIGSLSGEWVIFLGAGDFFWSFKVVGSIVPIIANAYPPYRVVYARVNVVKQSKILYCAGEPWKRVKKTFLQYMAIPHQGTIHHCSLFQKYGVFNNRYKIAGDYDLLLKELRDNDALFITNCILVGMQYGGISSNPENKKNLIAEYTEIHRNNGEKYFLLLWYLSMLRGNIYHFLKKIFGDIFASRITKLYRFFLCKGDFSDK